MEDNYTLKGDLMQEILRSKLDKSVNFVEKQEIGYLESRFVRREDKYFIVYISSQTGCEKACRMCHLTATGQNKFKDASEEEIYGQADNVLSYYDENENKAKLVHFNFMARGEPFDNPNIVKYGDRIVKNLNEKAVERGLESKTLFSTIFPNSFVGKDLREIFPNNHPEIYYSIYSTDSKFRKKWLPRAMPLEESMFLLKSWQDFSKKMIKLHFAFIKGENDSLDNMKKICELTDRYQLKVNMNVVRYNPYSSKYGEESDEDVINRNVEFLKNNLYGLEQIRVVPKVGFDVKASCGMFVK